MTDVPQMSLFARLENGEDSEAEAAHHVTQLNRMLFELGGGDTAYTLLVGRVGSVFRSGLGVPTADGDAKPLQATLVRHRRYSSRIVVRLHSSFTATLTYPNLT